MAGRQLGCCSELISLGQDFMRDIPLPIHFETESVLNVPSPTCPTSTCRRRYDKGTAPINSRVVEGKLRLYPEVK